MKNSPDYSKLYSIAESQAGYFSSKQAKNAGYSWERLSDLSKSGKFTRITHGVYRISLFPVSANEDLFIALLKSGEKAVLSHESALSVYELSDAMPGEIHVTIPRTSSRRREGIIFHTKTISEREMTKYEGLRVTTVPRTIIDLLESGFDPIQMGKAIDEALQRGLTTKGELLNAAGSRRASTGKTLSQYLDQVDQ